MDLKFLKKLIIVTLGSLIVSGAIYLFMVPYNLTIGGTAGLAIALAKFIPGIPVGIFLLLINVVLFVLAFMLIGSEFGGFSIYSTIVLSLLLALFEKLYPNIQPIADNKFMSMLLGVGFVAIGVAITLNQNASTGGTDIVAKILNKYAHVDLSKGVFIADFFVILIGTTAYGIEAGLYGLVGVVINAMVIDKVLTGYKTKIKVLINSEKWNIINDYILTELLRGSTLYEAKGGFNKNDKVIIETVLSRSEYIKLINQIKILDQHAFVNVNTISEVLGEGFSIESDKKLELIKQKKDSRK